MTVAVPGQGPVPSLIKALSRLQTKKGDEGEGWNVKMPELPEQATTRVEELSDKEFGIEVIRADGDFKVRERYLCVFTIVPSMALKRIEVYDSVGRAVDKDFKVAVEEEDDLTQKFKDWLLCKRKSPVGCGPQEFEDGNFEMTLWSAKREMTNEEVRAVQRVYLFDQV